MQLREFEPADADFLLVMRGDPIVMRYYPKTLTRDECSEWIARQLERYARDGHGSWLVEDRATGEPRGTVGLMMQHVEGEELPEIGYMIDRRHWRQGLAYEAACGVREHAFDVLGYDRVISLVRPINEPSQAVARKLGMQPWKQIMHWDLEHIVFTITRRDRDAHLQELLTSSSVRR
jgi:[ribosomal protein S5]-alanine N-acetyltransferase